MNSKATIFLIIIFAILVWVFFFTRSENDKNNINTVSKDGSEILEENNFSLIDDEGKEREFGFESIGLKTNTSKASIPLELVLDGGPRKDGIPAILNPKFTSIAEAKKWLKEDVDGIVVTVGKTTRFYPYNIIVWHEIVNDEIEKKPLVVTFCPLCGSAIVFDAMIDGKKEQFGVSGKLYESNLLMYDKATESLWSQIIGEAVVGDRTGQKLTVYPSQVMSFKQAMTNYPNMSVLSKETGHIRSYDFSPYGDYNTNEDIYFPTSINDTRLPTKEIMYIVNFDEKSVAFKRSEISETKTAVVLVGNKKISAKIVDGEIEVKDELGEKIPGYTAMWFSWAIHHQEDGIVWQGFP